MAFMPILLDRLPTDIEQGARGGPTYSTTKQELKSGKVVRIVNWSQPGGEWDISYGISSEAELDLVKRFFHVARGAGAGFLFRPPDDFEIGDPADPVASSGVIGTGDGVTKVFQIVNRWILPSGAFQDVIIRHPVAGTVSVLVDGNLIPPGAGAGEYQIDLDTGIVTFGTSPANGLVVSAACEFDVLVNFRDDKWVSSQRKGKQAEIPSIVLEMIKEG